MKEAPAWSTTTEPAASDAHSHIVFLFLSLLSLSSSVFPGIGLGALVCQAKYISDSMLYVAARALAAAVKDEDMKLGKVFPPVGQIRNVTEEIALASQCTEQ